MAKDYLNIIRQTGFLYLFNLIIFLTLPILTSILTRTLSLEEFGVYSIFAVTISFFTVTGDLGFSNYIIARLAGRPSNLSRKVLCSLFLFFIVYLFGIVAILLLFGFNKLFLSILDLTQYNHLFIFLVVVILSNLLFRILNAYLQSRKEVVASGFLGFLNLTLWIYFLFFYFYLKRELSLPSVFLFWSVGSFLSLVLILCKTGKDLFGAFPNNPFSFDDVKLALGFSIPLILFQTGDWLIQIADRYIIKYYYSLSSVALYNLAYTLVGFIISIANVVAAVLYPYYSASFNSRKDSQVFVNLMLKYVLLITLPAVVGLFVLRNAIITLLSGPAYLESAAIIPLLILFPIFGVLNIILCQTLILNNRTRLVALIYTIGAVINISLNLAFIPVLGVKAAALTTTLSYLFIFVFSFASSRKYLDIDWGFIRVERIILSSILMGIVILFINPQSALTKIITIILAAIIYLAVIFLFRTLTTKEIEQLVLFIKKRAKI